VQGETLARLLTEARVQEYYAAPFPSSDAAPPDVGEADEVRERKLLEHFHADLDILQAKGYGPGLGHFRMLLSEHGAVGTARRLLDRRPAQHGLTRLWELRELERSVEFVVLLPWFRHLFEEEELAEARRRLEGLDFPVEERLDAWTADPPEWTQNEALGGLSVQRGRCPHCTSGEVTHMVYGLVMPSEGAPEPPSWVQQAGCVVFEDSMTRRCESCGYEWDPA
jgi:hypothetical protein